MKIYTSNKLLLLIAILLILFFLLFMLPSYASNEADLMSKLKLNEGISRYVYKDHLGYSTISIGRNVDRRCKRGLTIQEMDYLLVNDIEHSRELLEQYNWYLKQDKVRQDALIEMCFQLGLPRLLKFKKMIKALDKKDYETAYKEALDSKWRKQVGKRAYRIAHSFVSDTLE